jgi:hypothetical protein
MSYSPCISSKMLMIFLDIAHGPEYRRADRCLDYSVTLWAIGLQNQWP